MREIKFRYWMHWKHNSDNGWMEYFELDPVKLPKLVHTGPKETVNKFPHHFRNYVAERDGEDQLDYAIMQYTGLKDKNGKEIWEGDILRYTHKHLGHPIDFEIVYYDGGFSQRRLTTKIKDMPSDHCDNIMYDWYLLEIIGNVHENPELLGD